MEPVLGFPDVLCTTKNSFLHFEEAPRKVRQRCYSDATNLRSYAEDGYDTASTAETAGTESEADRSQPEVSQLEVVSHLEVVEASWRDRLFGAPQTEAAPAPEPEQPYLLDLVSRGPAAAPQYLLPSTEEEAPKKKKRREVPPPQQGEITLMVRNIPNKYTPEGLLNTFAEYQPWITFYYLPTDFKNKCNLGYAFVNFSDHEQANKFAAELENSKLPLFERSEKVLLVQPARVQGVAANVKRFRNSSVMGVLPEDCKPMIFEDGVQRPFPMPGKKLPPIGPRFRPNAQ